MSLMEHAMNEMRIAGWLDTDCPMQQSIRDNVLAMLQLFADAGHSGSSAAYTMVALIRLMSFMPLTPLTGKPDEFTNDNGFRIRQNKRYSKVFVDEKYRAFDINGNAIKFPYYPETTKALQ